VTGVIVSHPGRIIITDVTVRENVHQLVDMLPEGQLDDALDYLAELSEVDEPMSADVLAAVDEARVDYRSNAGGKVYKRL
jgi:hypothetical protein